MGWGSGSSLAADVWKAVRFLIPAGDSRMIAARKITYEFQERDCDTILEAEELCDDAGYVYDEGRGEHVYTPLPGWNGLCEIGVPCCECPKAPQNFLYVASAARKTDREHYLTLARIALTPNTRAYYMAKADNAKTDPCRDCQFGSQGYWGSCQHVDGPARRASFAREPGPASVNEAARLREAEREAERASHYHGIPLPPNVTAQNMDDVGNIIAAEALRRAVAPKPAPFNPCLGCNGSVSSCHVCEFGGP
jgi:hypothetical protein